jgi:hypothetical protein
VVALNHGGVGGTWWSRVAVVVAHRCVDATHLLTVVRSGLGDPCTSRGAGARRRRGLVVAAVLCGGGRALPCRHHAPIDGAGVSVILVRRGGRVRAVVVASWWRWGCGGRASLCRHHAPIDGGGVSVTLVRRGGRVRAVVVASWWRAINICGGGGVVWWFCVAVSTPRAY